jgi:PleD family two-component response regulator
MQRDGWPVTFSVGVVTFRNAPESVDEMIRRADRLLYEVKGEGKDDLRHEVVVS